MVAIYTQSLITIPNYRHRLETGMLGQSCASLLSLRIDFRRRRISMPCAPTTHLIAMAPQKLAQATVVPLMQGGVLLRFRFGPIMGCWWVLGRADPLSGLRRLDVCSLSVHGRLGGG